MKRNYFILGLILLTFFVISFLTNIIGPLVPDIIRSFSLSLTTVALLPFAFFIAYGVMSIPSGILVEKYGEKKVMIVAFFISFLGALFFVISPGYLSYMLSLFLIGTGMAMLQVAINPLLRVGVYGCGLVPIGTVFGVYSSFVIFSFGKNIEFAFAKTH